MFKKILILLTCTSYLYTSDLRHGQNAIKTILKQEAIGFDGDTDSTDEDTSEQSKILNRKLLQSPSQKSITMHYSPDINITSSDFNRHDQMALARHIGIFIAAIDQDNIPTGDVNNEVQRLINSD